MNNHFSVLYALAAFIIMAAITIGLRALPFFAAHKLKNSPTIIRLGRILPPAIMVLLLLHSLGGLADQQIHNNSNPFWWRELTAAAAVLLIHLWQRQALLSIFGGTAFYVALRLL